MARVIAILATLIALCFAQEAPEKLAVYVYGTSDIINKALSNKILVAMLQNGNYAEIANPASFQEYLATNGKGYNMSEIFIAAKLHGADYVCVAEISEAFTAYSVTARLIKIADLQTVRIGTADSPIKSFDDLTVISNELARQLIPSMALQPLVTADKVATDNKQCAKTYNINELLYNLKNGFQNLLKDCSSKLAKEMALASMPFGKKSAAPEPKSFMKQCAIDGVKKNIEEDFPNIVEIIASVDKFVQSLLNSAFVGGALDPKKLMNAVSSMNIDELLSDIKKLANAACIVDEPYEPPVAVAAATVEESKPKAEKENIAMSFGIRTGFNLSHTYAENEYNGNSSVYGALTGFQVGFVVDIAASDWFHFQPGFMYIQKGMKDGSDNFIAHYVELPVLISLKFSLLRLNVGPYFGGYRAGNENIFASDFGLSTGFGFDIWKFYIGMFYDHGLTGKYNDNNDFTFYNRTLGFNLGLNL